MVGRREVVLGAAAAAGLAACVSAPTLSAPGDSAAGATGSRSLSGSGATGGTGTSGAATPGRSGPTNARPVPPVLTTSGPDVLAGPRGIPSVALTFHGAGTVETATGVLDLAARRSGAITVFAVGQWLAANPSIGRRIVDAGHDLGNHTWSHQQMRQLSPATDADEVRRGAEAVATILGTPGPLFRPSGTESSTAAIRSAAASAGYARCVSYDVDSLDYTDPGPAAVLATVTATLAPGSIVSLHLGHPGTVAALPAIFDLLARRGLAAVTVTALLSSDSPPVLAT